MNTKPTILLMGMCLLLGITPIKAQSIETAALRQDSQRHYAGIEAARSDGAVDAAKIYSGGIQTTNSWGWEGNTNIVSFVDCGECEGKVTEMTLRYNGAASAQIRVEQKQDGAIVFDGPVAPGETFTFVGADKKNTLGTEISIYINDSLDTTIHTSCSQPINPGLSFGQFTIVEAFSRNGGVICPDCIADAGPPEISFSINQDGNDYIVRVVVTDDTALGVVSYVPDPNLELVNETTGPQEVVYEFRIVDLRENSTLKVSATDLCSNSACTDDEAPALTTTFAVELVFDSNGNPIEDPKEAPGTLLFIDGRGTVTDNVGVELLDFFFLNNLRALFFEGDDVKYFGEATPPELGSSLVPFAIQLVNPSQGGRFGAIAADQCNAFIFDPASEGRDGEPGVSARMAGDESLVAQQLAVEETPKAFTLDQNYPNPFNPSTSIHFALPVSSPVSLTVYDMLGRKVAVLADGVLAAGRHEVWFDASHLASGTYLYRLVTVEQTFVKQMVLMK